MNLRALVERTRELLQDFGGDREVAWGLDDSGCKTSNAALVAHLHSGRIEYRLRHPIRDTRTPALCHLSVAPEALGLVTLDPRVLAVQVVWTADGDPLRRSSALELDQGRSRWRVLTGTPDCWLHDEDGVLRLVPMPEQSLALALTVDRLPLTDLAWSAADAPVSEIPPEHVDALRFWAAAEVLSDRDEMNPQGLGAVYLGRFDAVAGPPVDRHQVRVRARLAAGGLTVPGLLPGGRRRRFY